MANKWINHVKEYAKQHNLKYNDALKDTNCKSSYKKGSGIIDTIKNEGKKIVKREAKNLIDQGSNFIKNEVIGDGISGLNKKSGKGIIGDIGKSLTGFVINSAPIPDVARDIGKIGSNYLFDKSGLGIKTLKRVTKKGGALYMA